MARLIRQPPLILAPRTVVGYHGCSQESANIIVAGRSFIPSTRAYDWLGEGVYFWEYAPYRALEWARLKCDHYGGEPAVICSTVKLGRCLNLLDIEHVPGLQETYKALLATVGTDHVPRNTDRGAHFLDRRVIEAYCRSVHDETITAIQTVRGSFAEGDPIYPGSKIFTMAHVQIAVRDTSCLTRVNLVQFP